MPDARSLAPFLLLVSPLLAQAASDSDAGGAGAAPPLWIHAQRLILRPGEELEDAALLVEEGRIVAVGGEVEAPEGARRIEGQVVCAGFFDPWSTLGLAAGSAEDLGTSAATRSGDALAPWRLPHRRQEALRGGVTTARVQAGALAQIGGMGAVVRIDPGPGRDALLDDACVQATAGITRQGKELDVFERIEEVDRLAGMIEKGERYRESLLEYEAELAEWQEAIAEKREELEKDFEKAKKKREKDMAEAEEEGKDFKEKRYKEDKKPRKPKHDPDDEVMARAADGELPLVVEAQRAPEIRSLLEETEDYSRLRLVLAGGSEAAHLADELVQRRVPVIVWPAPLGEGEHRSELKAHDPALAGELHRAGIEVLIGSAGSEARDLRLLAALAVAHGLDRDAALHAITLGPARAFDVADRLGTLERGKEAEVLVFDGDPLDTTSTLRYVVSGGRLVVE